ncbi:phenylacetate--CoA ligase family protein [Methanosarcina mazei]|jgi:phenylacetate-CoA ligase|uniref:Phenylacetate-coenzyme A ligase n=2 Tax=Methanosarcina mazei TaxID=2209 RepID=A0A0E3RU34_METMZ|nr:phenylacetate--CoA ligase family protein [Methanosarcina mazei]AAM32332.1 Coenzyme F390 synthetase [Methanosarcina mazei Go1]AKB69577.1 Phenylacetate-coenzyme A ligase [Methanosarcina mazei LYC]MDY0247080.1 phenylacetate--CoA ligase family protein [Methanosarcina mazei]WIM42585.1 phenylacetate--CoA ligase family protein [Methanosarcina mazei]WIM46047.1 phenylacetate--CoA ligase family protein [Methanosarcina mazei]
MYEATLESGLDPDVQLYNPKLSEEDTLAKLKDLLKRVVQGSPFYQKKFREANVDIEKIKSLEDLKLLPFTHKEELRDAYPLGLQAVPDSAVVRIHSSSGTTGKPVIIPYTRNDVDTWAELMMRCYMLAGLTNQDRIQITPGYGLWTAGIGFQLGAERLGAMAIPTGPGNTEKQLEMLVDLKTTALASTSSYALLLAEEIEKRGLKDRIHLRTGVIGSERWSEKMRSRIENELGIETFDIYGLTEIYGPGIALDCSYHEGMHYWSDNLLFEIIDPITGEQLPDGTLGELVITTLTKEGAPLIRYRTRDLTRIIPGLCKCGCPFPRIDRILGRSDDRIKFKAVNIYPGQIEDIIQKVPGVSSEYQILLTRKDGRDSMTFRVEIEGAEDPAKKAKTEKALGKAFKDFIGVTVDIMGVKLGELPRSMKKTKRVIDEREL